MKLRIRAFTLIELLIVLAIMAALLSLVAPKYIKSVDKAKEAALKTNLRIIRESIDRYKADTGHYPLSLQDLVDGKYVRAIPLDPITDRDDSWALIPSPNKSQSGIYDIRSSAEGEAANGKPFSQL